MSIGDMSDDESQFFRVIGNATENSDRANQWAVRCRQLDHPAGTLTTEQAEHLWRQIVVEGAYASEASLDEPLPTPAIKEPRQCGRPPGSKNRPEGDGAPPAAA